MQMPSEDCFGMAPCALCGAKSMKGWVAVYGPEKNSWRRGGPQWEPRCLRASTFKSLDYLKGIGSDAVESREQLGLWSRGRSYIHVVLGTLTAAHPNRSMWPAQKMPHGRKRISTDQVILSWEEEEEEEEETPWVRGRLCIGEMQRGLGYMGEKGAGRLPVRSTTLI
ncbi:hypothetical protein LX32DRAFT_657673 [Colletotrichum zoysiae]|uniref:Uncharacterized protein n=1 Tax=Colletotrichum zoysiae TaxID=1216348 RepID=A0AAD9LUE9_9PEZI|nr:hypothetical protein LX32DRAFT_657673 [Colletotrichum zoysiae]